MKCITHTYQKINEKDEPKYILYYKAFSNSAGYNHEVGVFACKCIVCGKKKDMKFDMPINPCM